MSEFLHPDMSAEASNACSTKKQIEVQTEASARTQNQVQAEVSGDKNPANMKQEDDESQSKTPDSVQDTGSGKQKVTFASNNTDVQGNSSQDNSESASKTGLGNGPAISFAARRRNASSKKMIDQGRMEDFLPEHVAKYIENCEGKIKVPDSQHLESVAVFIDVSGFTKLTEKLAQGQNGNEQLGFYLNRYFERIVKMLNKSGGDVCKFAGDAIIVLWQPDYLEDGSVDICSMVCKAAQCCLSLQEELHGAVLAKDVTFSVKIGIGTGSTNILHLGGLYSRMEYLICGEALLEAFECEARCSAGDTVVSPTVWKYAESSFKGEPVKEKVKTSPKYMKLKANVVRVRNISVKHTILNGRTEIEALKSYVPAAVKPFLNSHQARWSAELRTTTIVFVNLGLKVSELVGVTEQQLQDLQTMFLKVQRLVYQYEGSVNKFLVDDKGSTLLIVWGLPPVTHLDDSYRGVLFALNLAVQMHAEQKTCFVGLTTGTILSGPIGSGSRREYSILGDPVNTSARLMQAAAKTKMKKDEQFAGCILCAEDIKKQVDSNEITFEELEPILLKGKVEPVPIFQPGFKVEKIESDITKKISTDSDLVDQQAQKVATIGQRVDLKLAYNFDICCHNEDNSYASTFLVLGGLKDGKSMSLATFQKTLQSEYGGTKTRLRNDKVEEVHLKIEKPGKIEKEGSLFFNSDVRNQPVIINGKGNISKLTESAYPFVWMQVVFQLGHILGKSESKRKLKEPMKDMIDYEDFFPQSTSVNFEMEIDNQSHSDYSKKFFKGTRNLLDLISKVVAEGYYVCIVLDDAHWMSDADWFITRIISLAFRRNLKTNHLQNKTNSSTNKPGLYASRISQTLLRMCDVPRQIPNSVLVVSTRSLHRQTEAHHFRKVNKSYMRLLRGIETQIVQIEKLDLQQIEQLICTMYNASSVTSAVTSLVMTMTDGNTCFVKDTVVALKESEDVIVTSGSCKLTRMKRISQANILKHPLPVPINSSRIVSSWLDMLSTTSLLLIKCASALCIGFDETLVFELSMLVTLFPQTNIKINKVDNHDQGENSLISESIEENQDNKETKEETNMHLFAPLFDSLNQMAKLQLIRPITNKKRKKYVEPHELFLSRDHFEIENMDPDLGDLASVRFTFTNAIIRDVVYARMLLVQKKRLHREIAEIVQKGLYATDARLHTKIVRKSLLWMLLKHALAANDDDLAQEVYHDLFTQTKVRGGSLAGVRTGATLWNKARRNVMQKVKNIEGGNVGNVLYATVGDLLTEESFNPAILERAQTKRQVLDSAKEGSGKESSLRSAGHITMGKIDKSLNISSILSKCFSFFRSSTKIGVEKTAKKQSIKDKDIKTETKVKNDVKERRISSVALKSMLGGDKIVPLPNFTNTGKPRKRSGLLGPSKSQGFAQSLLNFGKSQEQSLWTGRGGNNAGLSSANRRHLARHSNKEIRFVITRLSETLDSWDFDVFEFERYSQGMPLFTISRILFHKYGILHSFTIPQILFDAFAKGIETGYPPNPYHNSLHATDVLITVNSLLKVIAPSKGKIPVYPDYNEEKVDGNGSIFSKFDLLNAFIASMIHDFKHPGVSSQFLVITKDEITVDYNEPFMESYHYHEAMRLIEGGNGSRNIFKTLRKENVLESKKCICNLVLSTSLTQHFSFLESFNENQNRGMGIAKYDDRQLILQLAIKCADVSNPAKTLEVYKTWVTRIMNEFYAQGDLEQELNIPVSEFMDSSVDNVTKCQKGFITFIVNPLFEVLGSFHPASKALFEKNLSSNLSIWIDEEEEETQIQEKNEEEVYADDQKRRISLIRFSSSSSTYTDDDESAIITATAADCIRKIEMEKENEETSTSTKIHVASPDSVIALRQSDESISSKYSSAHVTKLNPKISDLQMSMLKRTYSENMESVLKAKQKNSSNIKLGNAGPVSAVLSEERQRRVSTSFY